MTRCCCHGCRDASTAKRLRLLSRLRQQMDSPLVHMLVRVFASMRASTQPHIEREKSSTAFGASPSTGRTIACRLAVSDHHSRSFLTRVTISIGGTQYGSRSIVVRVNSSLRACSGEPDPSCRACRQPNWACRNWEPDGSGLVKPSTYGTNPLTRPALVWSVQWPVGAAPAILSVRRGPALALKSFRL